MSQNESAIEALGVASEALQDANSDFANARDASTDATGGIEGMLDDLEGVIGRVSETERQLGDTVIGRLSAAGPRLDKAQDNIGKAVGSRSDLAKGVPAVRELGYDLAKGASREASDTLAQMRAMLEAAKQLGEYALSMCGSVAPAAQRSIEGVDVVYSGTKTAIEGLKKAQDS